MTSEPSTYRTSFPRRRGIAVLAAYSLLGAFPLSAEPQDVSRLPDTEFNLTAERAYTGYRGTCEEDPEVGPGVRVIEVFEGEAAQYAGLQVDDFIFKINNEHIEFSNDLEMVFHMGKYAAGKVMTLDVKRGGSPQTIVFTPGGSSQEHLDKLKRWIGIAKERVNSGRPLYCGADCQAEPTQGQRWAMFQLAIKGREVVLKIARTGAGDSGIELALEPAIELPFGTLEPVDLNPQLGSIARGLREGDSVQLRVSCGPEGNLCEVRTVGPLPEYLRELALADP